MASIIMVDSSQVNPLKSGGFGALKLLIVIMEMSMQLFCEFT